MKNKNKKTFSQVILSILVKKKAISEEESKALRVAFKRSSKEIFDDFLLEEGLVEKANLLEALAEYYQVPFFDVVGYFFKTHLLHMFPKGFLLRNAIIPIEVDENIMVMVASEPDDPDLLAKVGNHVSYNIRFRVGLKRNICDTVKEFYDKSISKRGMSKQEEHKLADEAKNLENEDEEGFVRYTEEEID